MIPTTPPAKRNFYPRSPCGERQGVDGSGSGATSISIHALLAESDKNNTTNSDNQQTFLSTLSLRRATSLARLIRVNTRHFYPRSPCGERRHLLKRCRSMSLFLSTLSLRRATGRVSSVLPGLEFLSTLSLRRATSIGTLRTVSVKNFYPRSPCGERPPAGKVRPWASHISIHALLAESDLGNVVAGLRTLKFLSTLSLRRATPFCNAGNSPTANFYPRSPCGERLNCKTAETAKTSFLSTLSLRRATFCHTNTFAIITHFYPRSPCGERRLESGADTPIILHFYPRSPCGERPRNGTVQSTHRTFLSTLSLRRATAVCWIVVRFLSYFYPRSPCGERQLRLFLCHFELKISIHALLAESDKRPRWLIDFIINISIHALLAESDDSGPDHIEGNKNFYPRSPCGERLHAPSHSLYLRNISIHALLAESDNSLCGRIVPDQHISIHALLAESDSGR